MTYTKIKIKKISRI